MKKIVAFLFFCGLCVFSSACTTFLLNDDGHYYFGRNYDWITGNGMVMTNARNVKKSSATKGSKVNWISKYGSISFNQYGKEFPTGGMNEKGLVVELMWLDETRYPSADHRPSMNVLQWIQYQLDNCQSIEEVISSDKEIRINTDGTPLHYLIADANGNVATIEFLDGKLVVHKGKDLSFAVLTNSTYAESVEKTKASVKAERIPDFSDNSIQRFAQACSMINNYKDANKTATALDYSFSILNKVSQGSFTKWSIVYDISEKKIHFVTGVNRNRRTVAFSDFNLECFVPSMAIGMDQAGSGNIFKAFKKLSFDQNKKLVEISARESASRVRIPPSAIKETVDFYNKTICAVTEKMTSH